MDVGRVALRSERGDIDIERSNSRVMRPKLTQFLARAREAVMGEAPMAILTTAELLQYPGTDLTEKAYAEHLERGPLARTKPALRAGTLGLARRVDIRPFPGRDRLERVMHYLRAHFPRADSWSEESLRDLARSLIVSAEIID